MECRSKLPTANTQILRSTVLKLGVRLSLCPGFVYPSFVTKNSELLVQNPYDAFLNTWYLKFVKHSTSCVTTIVVMGLISFHSLPYLYFTLLTSCSPFSWIMLCSDDNTIGNYPLLMCLYTTLDCHLLGRSFSRKNRVICNIGCWSEWVAMLNVEPSELQC